MPEKDQGLQAITLSQNQENMTLLPKEWKICPRCKEEYQNLSFAGICVDCQNNNNLQRQRETSGLPKRYLEMTFEEFKQTTQNHKMLYSAAQDFIKNDKGLYISGNAGQGKTHIAVAIMQKLQGLGARVKFESVPELFLRLRSSFKTDGFDERVFIDQYGNCEFLVLDDLGAEKASDYNLQTLYLIFDRRYRNTQNKIVITSNLTLQELAEATSDRICSRIAEMCQVIEVFGKDWRLKQ